MDSKQKSKHLAVTHSDGFLISFVLAWGLLPRIEVEVLGGALPIYTLVTAFWLLMWALIQVLLHPKERSRVSYALAIALTVWTLIFMVQLVFLDAGLEGAMALGRIAEAMVLILLIAETIRVGGNSSVRRASKALVFTIVINGSWFLVQALTNSSGPLFARASGGPEGLVLIAEESTFQTAFYWLLALGFCSSHFLSQSGRYKIFAVLGVLLSLVALIGTGSRSTVLVGWFLIVLLFSWVASRIVPISPLGMVVVGASCMLGGISAFTFVIDRFNSESIVRHMLFRVYDLWIPAIGSMGDRYSPLLGAGSGALRSYAQSEVHNSYLLVAGDYGVLGILLFVGAHFWATSLVWSAGNKFEGFSNTPAEQWKVIAVTAVVGMSVTGLFQDSILAARPLAGTALALGVLAGILENYKSSVSVRVQSEDSRR